MYFKPKNNRSRFSGFVEPYSRRMSFERSQTSPSSPLCEGAMHLVPADSLLLAAWKIPSELWCMIGKRMREQIEAVQYAGASVQASINRLDKLWIESGGKITEEDIYEEENRAASECKILVTLRDIHLGFTTADTPGLTESSSQPISQSTSRSNSFRHMPISGLGIDLKSSAPSSPGLSVETGLVSPYELSLPPLSHQGPGQNGRLTRSVSEVPIKLPDLSVLEISTSEYKPRRGTVSGFLPREEEFITPARSTIVYRWRAELEYLRTDSLVALRHGLDQIFNEWEQTKRDDNNLQLEYVNRNTGTDYSQARIPHSIRDPEGGMKFKDGMDQWLAEKRKLVQELTEKAESYEGGVICRWGATRRT
jgi:hypothetical protein